jgi:PTS system mannose-specific IIA component
LGRDGRVFFEDRPVFWGKGDGMIGVVVVTHCRLAEELIAAAELIVGRLKGFKAVSIDSKSNPDEIRDKIAAGIRKVDRGGGVLVLTDMFGGTPSTISFSFLQENKIEVVTGVNLPMLLKLSTYEGETTLSELARFIRSYGQKNINIASEILKQGMTQH